ncbi:hypothetical protein [Helicobacter rodentium]|nr:hypothetical protein [Helicobacter rodentium]
MRLTPLSLRGLCPKQSIIKQIENFTTSSLRGVAEAIHNTESRL